MLISHTCPAGRRNPLIATPFHVFFRVSLFPVFLWWRSHLYSGLSSLKSLCLSCRQNKNRLTQNTLQSNQLLVKSEKFARRQGTLEQDRNCLRTSVLIYKERFFFVKHVPRGGVGWEGSSFMSWSAADPKGACDIPSRPSLAILDLEREPAPRHPCLLPSISDRPPLYAVFPSKSILVGTRIERELSRSRHMTVSQEIWRFFHPVSHKILVCDGLHARQDRINNPYWSVQNRNSSQDKRYL
jgi:hypothetical protein